MTPTARASANARDLLTDVRAVWHEDESAVWCEQLVGRLVALAPHAYSDLALDNLGTRLREAGVHTVQVHRKVNGKGYTRRGVRLEALREQLREQIKNHRAVVYFAERHGFVKIGTTANLPARIASLNRGDSAITGMLVIPVNVLATMPGGQPVERSIHQLFERLRYDGEWFLLDEPLTSFVRAVAAARQP